MELRFATVSLKIPLIVVIVGTGFRWEAMEVGTDVLWKGLEQSSCRGLPKTSSWVGSTLVIEGRSVYF